MAAWVQLASVETPDSTVCVVLGTRHERYVKANDGTPASCSSIHRWFHTAVLRSRPTPIHRPRIFPVPLSLTLVQHPRASLSVRSGCLLRFHN